jgi:two-component system cell cycle sensor histidine kinase/response regulator CckA
LLVQEIGQATSTILNPRNLIETMSRIMEKRLDFDRGAIWLASKDRTRLIFQFGYGYSDDQESLLRNTQFHLDNPRSVGPFVTSFKEQKPVLLNDIHENGGKLSERSLFLAKELKVQSLVCVPIIYEKESLGVLTVDNMHSKRPLTKTDMSLLIGVASQAAMSLVNARSFQNMQDSEKKYRELVENANSIILRVDTDGGIIFFNEFAQRFFGYKEDEILGKNVVSTVLPATEAAERGVQVLIDRIRAQPEKRLTTESRTQRRSGETVWIAWTFKPILDTEGAVQEILCIGNDITELKIAERKRRELEMRLQRAQKMEAIGTLAGGVAHDLNNILAGLVSYPELLLMQIPDDSKLRKPISTIQKAGEKAASIVQDLLTLARRGVSASEVLNLNQVVSDYLRSPEFESLRAHHPEVEVEVELERDLLNILGSPVHISKTVMNLVSNAAEAMPDGGRISLSTRNMYLDRPIGGFTQVDEGDYAVLTVSDTGIGIPAEDLDRIFEPFFTKKRMGRSGTGLGMAVVWGTVKDHNGYIDVKSEEGRGTSFNLYFPITRKDLAGDAAKPVWEDYKGRGESILVVDDVLEQREVAQGIMEQLGYDVTCLSSGEEAVEFMKSHSVDLLVLDMIMTPGMDGLETYRKILELRPGQKAIIASGFSESDKVKEAQELGAGAYVKKPYLMEKIGIIMREELDR